jgi:hypothetical protein
MRKKRVSRHEAAASQGGPSSTSTAAASSPPSRGSAVRVVATTPCSPPPFPAPRPPLYPTGLRAGGLVVIGEPRPKSPCRGQGEAATNWPARRPGDFAYRLRRHHQCECVWGVGSRWPAALVDCAVMVCARQPRGATGYPTARADRVTRIVRCTSSPRSLNPRTVTASGWPLGPADTSALPAVAGNGHRARDRWHPLTCGPGPTRMPARLPVLSVLPSCGGLPIARFNGGRSGPTDRAVASGMWLGGCRGPSAKRLGRRSAARIFYSSW